MHNRIHEFNREQGLVEPLDIHDLVEGHEDALVSEFAYPRQVKRDDVVAA